MGKRVEYEWCIEWSDMNTGDIIDLHHAPEGELHYIIGDWNTFNDAGHVGVLVLVRDEGDLERTGVDLRLWAYPDNVRGLPEFMSDLGRDGYEGTGYAIPKRLHSEFKKATRKQEVNS